MHVLVFGVCSQLVNWKKAPVRIKSYLKLGGLTGKLAEEVGKKSRGRRIIITCRGSVLGGSLLIGGAEIKLE